MSLVHRTHFGIFGRVNQGKSTLMNALTQQETSIIDSTAGTTADVKISHMQLHKFGPSKLFDTAGLDEIGILGEKKKKVTLDTLKQSDVAFIVVGAGNEQCFMDDFAVERDIIKTAEKLNKRIVFIVNEVSSTSDVQKALSSTSMLPSWISKSISSLHQGTKFEDAIKSRFPTYPILRINLTTKESGHEICQFIEKNLGVEFKSKIPSILPPFLSSLASSFHELHDHSVLMNIPMDDETPQARLLRPQAMTQEECLRRYISTYAFRMDLTRGRKQMALKKEGKFVEEDEKKRFQDIILQTKPSLVVTDSQAIDLVLPWMSETPDLRDVKVTTFSIAMANLMSGGRLDVFMEGLKQIHKLSSASKVLVLEACNHDRLTTICDDIGTVQIPRELNKMAPGITIDHAFGRVFPSEKLAEYDLAIHCGGCFLTPQTMTQRIVELEEAGVPLTNYGLFLGMARAPKMIKRITDPWEIEIE
ncbi:GTPase mss1/trme, putative [Aduncisulcus paluster]|uniref:GTPase mss1/trme, putative n=1 Tax=Aduncisulcus paluster TaxID=2918883 RepID=A0ABQ5KW99_9EUKA|nr:GTPase mss1/trme, putative [Aduncisulcus paluster]|eukprot:gnl/Carplike_NY0171/528_a726_3361.p1 GENE.gnl/Carplike_NY0171/528_a726_3361~~gnl/Carplike_NY0171/528_a726_3361.p1  ORF type:complete len:475 (+),score=95.11 gnl/Carplike_NY0171/528_a726_3361:59-1483(+)